jgi:hypothetical protein
MPVAKHAVQMLAYISRLGTSRRTRGRFRLVLDLPGEIAWTEVPLLAEMPTISQPGRKSTTSGAAAKSVCNLRISMTLS